MKNKSILVTGSSGFIGGFLVKRLKSENLIFTGLDKDPLMGESKIKLEDPVESYNFFDNFKPDIIIHCGTNSAGRYNQDFLEAYTEDSISLINILNYLATNAGTRLLYFSSSYVYSGCSNIEIKDIKIPNYPTHNFGIAKLFFENLITKNHKNSIIFRLTNVFGPGNHRNMTTIQNWVENGIAGKKIELWGEGNRKLQYVYIEDVTRLIMASDKLESGIYNVGGNEHNTTLSTAEFISEYFSSSLVKKEDKLEGKTLPYLKTEGISRQIPDFTFKPIDEAIIDYINKEVGNN